MPCDYNLNCERCQKVRREWYLQNIFDDLESIQHLTPRLKCWLIFLLNGDSPAQISAERYLSRESLNIDLSRNIYGPVSNLVNLQIGDWARVRLYLEPRYRINYLGLFNTAQSLLQEILGTALAVDKKKLQDRGISIEDHIANIKTILQSLDIDSNIEIIEVDEDSDDDGTVNSY